jgi:Xaa-Pro aminopeptidase
MAYTDRETLEAALQAEFVAAEVDPNPISAPANKAWISGVTYHAVRYLDTAGNSAALGLSRAVQVPGAGWFLERNLEARRDDQAALTEWVKDYAARTAEGLWLRVVTMQYNPTFDAASLTVVSGTAQAPVLKHFVVVPQGGGYGAVETSSRVEI